MILSNPISISEETLQEIIPFNGETSIGNIYTFQEGDVSTIVVTEKREAIPCTHDGHTYMVNNDYTTYLKVNSRGVQLSAIGGIGGIEGGPHVTLLQVAQAVRNFISAS